MTLHSEKLKNRINLELIFELKSLLNWAKSKVEITTILFQSNTPYFSIGLDSETQVNENFNYLLSLKKRIWDFQKEMMSLPQTCVIDFQLGASNIGIELFLGADLFLCSENATFKLDNFYKGLPVFTPKNLIEARFSKCLSKYLNKKTILSKNFELIDFKYLKDHQHLVTEVLKNINSQSSYTRIQSKMYFMEDLIEISQVDFDYEIKFMESFNLTEDWKGESFEPIKEVKKKIQLTLIDGGKSL